MTTHEEDLADVEARLRDALAPLRATTLPERTARAAVERGRGRRRVRRFAAAAAPVAAAVLVVVTALGIGRTTGGDDGGRTGPALAGPGWHRAAASPLSPRTSAFALPLDDGRVLVLGGSAEDPCPPNASCVARTEEPPLPRGAALYDPRTDSWERIADPPAPVTFGVAAVVGGTVYVLQQPTQLDPDEGDPERTLLAYSVPEDRWTRLPGTRAQVAGLVALEDGRLLAYTYSKPTTSPASRCAPPACGPFTVVFDPATDRWTDLPDDPLPATSARQVLPVRGGAILLAEEPVDGEPYAPWLMARWDAASDTWTRLPDPGIVDGAPGWFAVDGKLVNPSGDVVDAGARGLRPTGGIYDPDSGRWDTVPAYDPLDAVLTASTAGAGRVVTRGGAFGVASRRWSDLPRRPGDRVEYTATTVTADGLLVQFGGVRAEGPDAWSRDALTNELWVLRLP